MLRFGISLGMGKDRTGNHDEAIMRILAAWVIEFTRLLGESGFIRSTQSALSATKWFVCITIERADDTYMPTLVNTRALYMKGLVTERIIPLI